MEPILHDQLAQAPWMAAHTHRLPGIQPFDLDDWLRRDEVFAQQMALRDELVREKTRAVLGQVPGSEPAVAELLETVLAALAQDPGYWIHADHVMRPDGVRVPLGDPLEALARLVQEDLCVLEREADEHVMTAAALCFPAGWRLNEKLGRPLTAIHVPVPEYTPDLARRVQRMFDALRPGQGLWRANALRYADPALHQPEKPVAGDPIYLRSERQCLQRLPRTGAVIFSIHTTVIPLKRLSPAQRAGLEAGLVPVVDDLVRASGT